MFCTYFYLSCILIREQDLINLKKKDDKVVTYKHCFEFNSIKTEECNLIKELLNDII